MENKTECYKYIKQSNNVSRGETAEESLTFLARWKSPDFLAKS